jgi:hypothetical protein
LPNLAPMNLPAPSSSARTAVVRGFFGASALLWVVCGVSRSRLCPTNLYFLATAPYLGLAIAVQSFLGCLALVVAPPPSRENGARIPGGVGAPGILSSAPRDQAFFVAWSISSASCLVLLLFAIVGLLGHQKQHDLLGYFLLLGGGPLFVVGGHRWLLGRYPDSAQSALKGLVLVIWTEMPLLWILRDPQPWMLWCCVAGSWAGVMLPLRSARIARHT